MLGQISAAQQASKMGASVEPHSTRVITQGPECTTKGETHGSTKSLANTNCDNPSVVKNITVEKGSATSAADRDAGAASTLRSVAGQVIDGAKQSSPTVPPINLPPAHAHNEATTDEEVKINEIDRVHTPPTAVSVRVKGKDVIAVPAFKLQDKNVDSPLSHGEDRASPRDVFVETLGDDGTTDVFPLVVRFYTRELDDV